MCIYFRTENLTHTGFGILGTESRLWLLRLNAQLEIDYRRVFHQMKQIMTVA